MKVLSFWTKLINQKIVFRSKKGKMKHQRQILRIQISLGPKFKLPQTVEVFLEQIYPKKESFWSKIEKNERHH